MNFGHISESDTLTAIMLILLPNLVACAAGLLVINKLKKFNRPSAIRSALIMSVFVVVSNILAISLLSSLNPDHGFYWLDENEGATWAFALFPTSILFALVLASLYDWKLTR